MKATQPKPTRKSPERLLVCAPGKPGCLRHNRESFTGFLRKTMVIWESHVGMGLYIGMRYNSLSPPLLNDREQCMEIFLGIVGQNPIIVSRLNRVHVVIFHFRLYEHEKHSTYSSRMMANFPEV